MNVTIIDAIPVARYIFNSSFHPFQLYSIVVSQNLRVFFNKNSNNFITFRTVLAANGLLIQWLIKKLNN